MSETASCDLRIGHAMLGSDERSRFTDDLALRMGTALEPMIATWMADQGFTLYFTGEDQLEFFLGDPMRTGHGDGLIGIDHDVSHWAKTNIPQTALDIMDRGEAMVLEIKTANEKSFREFLEGGLKGGVFLRKYLQQINSYEAAVCDPAHDELWATHEGNPDDCPVLGYQDNGKTHYGSDSLKEVLKDHGWGRPTATLVVMYCPGLKRFGFEVHHYNRDEFLARSIELENNIILPMRQGQMPTPTYDGQADECYFCPYAYLCPAAQEVSASRTIDDIPIVVAGQDHTLDELAAEYHMLSEQYKELEAARKDLRERIDGFVGPGARIVTDSFFIHNIEVKGRRSIDQDELAKLLGGKENIPYKQGRPYTRKTIVPLYGPNASD
jgi:hypothetical protein